MVVGKQRLDAIMFSKMKILSIQINTNNAANNPIGKAKVLIEKMKI